MDGSGALSTVVFSGELLKQNRYGKFQKRTFRFDGLLLVCLSPKRLRLPENVSMLTFDPGRHGNSAEFAEALTRFYPTNPPLPALTNPLIASYDPNDSSTSIYTNYYHMPKWIIPTSTITSVKTYLSPQARARDPTDKLARTFVVRTTDREYILRAPTAALFDRWTFLLSSMAMDNTVAVANGEEEDTPRTSDTNDETEDTHYDEVEDDDVSYPAISSVNRSTVANSANAAMGGTNADYGEVDVTHDAIPRLAAWNASIADLVGRDIASRNSMVSISAVKGSNSGNTGPTVLRGQDANWAAPMNPSVLGANSALVAPRPLMRAPSIPRPHTSRVPSQHKSRPHTAATLATVPAAALPPATAPASREFHHTATALLRLARRLAGFANDNPAAMPGYPPSQAFVVQFAGTAVPHGLRRLAFRLEQRAVEIEAAASAGVTDSDSWAVAGRLWGSLEKVKSVFDDWEKRVGGPVRNGSVWKDVNGGSELLESITETVQDARRSYA